MEYRRLSLVRTVRAALLVLGLQAGGAHALGLMQAYQEALTHDPTFRSAIQEDLGGKEYRVLGRSALLPNVSASYSASRNRTDITAPDFFGEETTTHPVYISRSAVVQLRQTLFSLDAVARYKQGVAQTNYSDATFDARRQDLILRVVGAYSEALFAREQVRLAQAQRDTLAEQQKVNTRLFEKGEGTRTDALETQARLDMSEAQVLEAEDNLKVSLATLSGIVGHPVAALDELTDMFRVAAPEGKFEDWRDVALKNNPELIAAQYAIETARQEVNKNRAGHTPRLDFVASYSKSAADTINTYNQQSTVRSLGIQLNVPLYAGGAISASTRQAVAGLEKSRADLDANQDKVVVELKRQYAAVLSGMSKMAALDKAVKSGEELVKATQQSIKGGVRINLDLLNAQQQLYTSKRDLVQARLNYLMSLLRLRAAAGSLDVDSVREVAAYFR